MKMQHCRSLLRLRKDLRRGAVMTFGTLWRCTGTLNCFEKINKHEAGALWRCTEVQNGDRHTAWPLRTWAINSLSFRQFLLNWLNFSCGWPCKYHPAAKSWFQNWPSHIESYWPNTDCTVLEVPTVLQCCGRWIQKLAVEISPSILSNLNGGIN